MDSVEFGCKFYGDNSLFLTLMARLYVITLLLEKKIPQAKV